MEDTKIWYCLLCQEYGHNTSEKCVTNAICLSCGKKGHTRKDCIVNIEKQESIKEKEETNCIVKIEKQVNIKEEKDEKTDFPVYDNMVNAIIPEYVEPAIKYEKVFFKVEDFIKCEPKIELASDESEDRTRDETPQDASNEPNSYNNSAKDVEGEQCKVCGKFFANMLSHHYVSHFRDKLIEKYPSSFTGEPPFKCSKCKWCVRSKSLKIQQLRQLMLSHIIGCKDELEDLIKSRKNSGFEKGDSQCKICTFVCSSEDELLTHLYRKHEDLRRKIHTDVVANFSNFYTREAKKLNCTCPICGEEMKATRAIVGKHWAVDHKKIKPLY